MINNIERLSIKNLIHQKLIFKKNVKNYYNAVPYYEKNELTMRHLAIINIAAHVSSKRGYLTACYKL